MKNNILSPLFSGQQTLLLHSCRSNSVTTWLLCFLACFATEQTNDCTAAAAFVVKRNITEQTDECQRETTRGLHRSKSLEAQHKRKHRRSLVSPVGRSLTRPRAIGKSLSYGTRVRRGSSSELTALMSVAQGLTSPGHQLRFQKKKKKKTSITEQIHCRSIVAKWRPPPPATCSLW